MLKLVKQYLSHDLMHNIRKFQSRQFNILYAHYPQTVSIQANIHQKECNSWSPSPKCMHIDLFRICINPEDIFALLNSRYCFLPFQIIGKLNAFEVSCWRMDFCGYGCIIIMSGTKVVHRFLRSPNISSDIYNRVANRFSPFANTQVSLSDPASGRTLTLIGTTNSSTTLAHRTKTLLEKERPDAVYVQASPVWWNYAQHLDLPTQQLFARAAKDFPTATYKFQNHLRGILFRARYLTWRYFFESAMRFPDDFNLFVPGLETAYALKYAEKNKALKVFGGDEFDPVTIEALRLEPDLYFYTFLLRGLFTTFNTTSTWTSEYQDFNETVNVRGGQAFAESLDRSRINFLVGLFNKTAPKQKTILIDHRDERIFRELYGLKAKHTVAVVNQWHMEGIETHWRRLTGTELPTPNRSPVADMDIDAIQEKTLVNEFLREYTAGVTKSEPASWQDYSTGYHKENFEYERTRHTHHDTHEDIPAPGEKHHSHH